MPKNLMLCIVMHLFGKSSLCKCPLSGNPIENNETLPSNININYIHQQGNNNIAGGGRVNADIKNKSDSALLETLKFENLILKRIVKNLEPRDK